MDVGWGRGEGQTQNFDKMCIYLMLISLLFSRKVIFLAKTFVKIEVYISILPMDKCQLLSIIGKALINKYNSGK
jgi:hypothetical protein